MNTTNKDQVEKLLEDISFIKSTIDRNKPLLRQIVNLSVFRWFLLVVALSIIGFSMSFFFLGKYYGSFGAIPNMLKYFIFAAIAVVGIILQLWKGRVYATSVRQVDSGLSLGWLFKEFYSSSISQVYISYVVLLIFFSIFFIVHHLAYYIIPAVSILSALMSISYGVILHIRYSLAVGYWLLISGILVTIFSTIPAPIAVSLTFGCGMLILAVPGFLGSQSQQEDRSDA